MRAAELPHVKEILTVTNCELLFKTKEEFNAVNKTDILTSFILEPFGRNTAAAITAAALQVKRTHGEDAVLLILPADHLISDSLAFQKAVTEAVELAQN